MKKYGIINITNIINNIENDNFINICRLNKIAFIRKRKLTCKDLILYELNKRGLSTKMKILNFNNIKYVEDVSSPALFKQQEKILK